ncbi:MAG TPA: MFS transporter [Pseudonocardiaceae bacterium]|nr:MFS transporter [Pseudonocardiaceae bacterium]
MTDDPASAASLVARLDRLAWSRSHTTIVLALGAGWLFDSLEVQLFSNAVGPLGSYFHASVLQQDAILAVWLAGILLGALTGGWLTDRFGRRRMFVATLLWYAGFTVLTGLAAGLWFVYVARFVAALGVGAEYAIVNAAIAELVPARVRGRANAVVMNFWPAGAVAAGLVAYLVLDTLDLAAAVSWRYLFVSGGVVALVVLYFRRRIPESPRWLLARGGHAEAERIVTELETAAGAAATTTPPIATAPIPLAPAAQSALGELVHHYRGRLALGMLLDLAEAFGYYGIFALLSVVVLPRVHIAGGQVPLFYVVGNLGALAGGLAMTLFVDRLGRRTTVTTCYTLAAAGVGLLAWATASGSAAAVTVAFVVANGFGTAAWTSAYPTFTELFPTHLRGAGVGASVAVGRVGAIVGTLVLPGLATRLGPTASYLLVVGCWLVGVAAITGYRMAGGVESTGRSLETLAVSPAGVEA